MLAHNGCNCNVTAIDSAAYTTIISKFRVHIGHSESSMLMFYYSIIRISALVLLNNTHAHNLNWLRLSYLTLKKYMEGHAP